MREFLRAIAGVAPLIPASFAEESKGELVGVSGGSRRNRLNGFFGAE